MTPTLEKLPIFSCLECRKKGFTSIMALNNHLTKAHDVSYKIHLNHKGHASKRVTMKIKVSKASLTKYF